MSLQMKEQIWDDEGRWSDDEIWNTPNNISIFVETNNLQDQFSNDPYIYAKNLVGAVVEGCQNILDRRVEFEADSKQEILKALNNPIFPPPDSLRWIFKAKAN